MVNKAKPPFPQRTWEGIEETSYSDAQDWKAGSCEHMAKPPNCICYAKFGIGL